LISLERRDGRPLVIGHRGAPALAPENTLPSFRAALAAGVDLVEFDVVTLRAGELVVAHSDDLLEMSHGAVSGSIGALSFRELRELCPELPSLDETLGFFAEEARDIGLHVDLKSTGAVDHVAAALERFGLVERTLVSSFHLGALRRLSRLEPRVRIGASFPQDRLGINERPGFRPVVTGSLRGLRLLAPALVPVLLTRARATTLVLHHELVTPAAVGRAHARGAPVVAWTVDDPEELFRLTAAGVDAFVTNDPSRFVSTLKT